MRAQAKDSIGKRYGFLTVIEIAGVQDGNSLASARCDCGKLTIKPLHRLKSGRTTSCGCQKRGRKKKKKVWEKTQPARGRRPGFRKVKGEWVDLGVPKRTKEEKKEFAKNYYQANKKDLNARQRHLYQSDTQFRKKQILYTEFYPYMRAVIALKTNKGIDQIGCSLGTLITHIESLFSEGMCWSNYGNKKDQWSIDHIKPIDAFDLTIKEERKACWHYTNLQPLWHIDNMKKGKKHSLPD